MDFLRVNIADGVVSVSPTPDKYLKFGGRALTSRIIADEIPAICDPLGPENKLIIATGLLTGTTAPCSGRISIGAKSPLTGGIKESNVGGVAGANLARAGIRAIIIEGAPSDSFALKTIVIAPGGARLEDASHLKGLGTYETAEKLRALHGDKAAVLCVGPQANRGWRRRRFKVLTWRDAPPARRAGAASDPSSAPKASKLS
ncbi:MAG TPA: aldehyde ferredoxin oxidoreductase N-terminal domain-containing protein [bacterium]|nr:aldehyde ferredoxin oxidoreductase N-terminal domain-containing protein [bacterium]